MKGGEENLKQQTVDQHPYKLVKSSFQLSCLLLKMLLNASQTFSTRKESTDLHYWLHWFFWRGAIKLEQKFLKLHSFSNKKQNENNRQSFSHKSFLFFFSKFRFHQKVIKFSLNRKQKPFCFLLLCYSYFDFVVHNGEKKGPMTSKYTDPITRLLLEGSPPNLLFWWFFW